MARYTVELVHAQNENFDIPLTLELFTTHQENIESAMSHAFSKLKNYSNGNALSDLTVNKESEKYLEFSFDDYEQGLEVTFLIQRD